MFEEDNKTISRWNKLIGFDDKTRLFISSNDNKKKNTDKFNEIIDLINDGKTFSQLPEQLAELVLVGEKEKKFDPKCDEDITKVLEKIKYKYVDAGMKKYYDDGRVLRNWLKGESNPQFTYDPRTKEKIIQLFFAFEMNKEKCEEFASRAFFIQAFDYRNIRDLIALYCINNGLCYKCFADICKSYKEEYCPKKNGDKYMPVQNCAETKVLSEQINKINTETDLDSFIKSNKTAFEDDHKSARYVLQKLYEKLEEKWQDVFRDNPNDHTPKVEELNITYLTDEEDYYGLPLKDDIKDSQIIDDVKESLKNVFNGSTLSDVKRLMGNINNLRKLIILFHFYNYHYKKISRSELEEKVIKKLDNNLIEEQVSRYTRTVNALMVRCNLQPLYLRNPYDFIFIYSSGCLYPIETFQLLVAKITDNWPEKGVNVCYGAHKPNAQAIFNMILRTTTKSKKSDNPPKEKAKQNQKK